MATQPSAAPPPRRIHLDTTGWSLLRDAAATIGLPVERLPEAGGDPVREDEVRRVLVAQDLLDGAGAPGRSVHAALAVLTTAPIAIGVERVEAERSTRAVWRTAGVPTAGVVVRDRLDGDPAGADDAGAEDPGRGRGARCEVELQLLAVEDLLDLVLDELATDDGRVGTTDGGTDDHRVPVEVDADDPGALPTGLLVDDRLVARAAVTVEGPGGTTVAQLLGDGSRWWQVGSAGTGRLRLLPVREATLRASLVDALTAQLTAGAPATGEASGG
jgi:hypothetical protein